MRAEFGIFEAIYMKSVDCLRAIRSGNHLDARREFDKLRQLRSGFSRFASKSDTLRSDELKSELILPSMNVVARAALENINQIEAAYPILVFGLADTNDEMEKWHRLFDVSIPPTWNWEGDVVFLNAEPSAALKAALVERGQRRVVYLPTGDSSSDPTQTAGSQFIPFGDQSLNEDFSNWLLDPPELFHSIAIGNADHEPGKRELRMLSEMFSVAGSGRTTALAFSRTWVRQQYENAYHACRGYTHEALLNLLADKDVIIISPGPSLQRNIGCLSDARGKAILIATAQACPALTAEGIAPDFVIFSDPGDYVGLVSDFVVKNSFGLIANVTCHPGFFTRGFSRIFPIVSSICVNGLNEVFCEDRLELFGGSVSVNAFSLCIKSRSRSVALVGQDLSFGKEVYFNRPGSSNVVMLEGEPDYMMIGGVRHQVFRVPGYYGGEVVTKQDYWFYHRQFEELACGDDGDVAKYNCTEGGAYIEGFVNIPLSDYIKKLGSVEAISAIASIDQLEVRRRLSALRETYRRQINEIGKVTALCDQILTYLSDGDVKFNTTRISTLEASLISVVRPILSLDFIMQAALITFGARGEQIESFEENVVLSIDLYESIKNKCGYLEGVILSALNEIDSGLTASN